MKRGVLFFALGAVAACGDDADRDLGSVDAGALEVGVADLGALDAAVPPLSLIALADAEGLDELVSRLTVTGLRPALEVDGPFTLLAPTDAAFEAFSADAPTDLNLLTNLLLGHVIGGRWTLEAIMAEPELHTLATLRSAKCRSPSSLSGRTC